TRSLARATDAAAGAAKDAGRLAVEAGRAAGRSVESVAEAGATVAGVAANADEAAAPMPATESFRSTGSMGSPAPAPDTRGGKPHETDIAERAVEGLANEAKFAGAENADREPRFAALDEEKTKDR